jgi:hypothetical protein
VFLKILPDNPGIATNTTESTDYGYGSGAVYVESLVFLCSQVSIKGAEKMSNLKAIIVVRTKGPDRKRGWVPATGKNDPVGPQYLRYYKGSSPKHIKAGRFYDEAEVAELRPERKLKAASMGLEGASMATCFQIVRFGTSIPSQTV